MEGRGKGEREKFCRGAKKREERALGSKIVLSIHFGETSTRYAGGIDGSRQQILIAGLLKKEGKRGGEGAVRIEKGDRIGSHSEQMGGGRFCAVDRDESLKEGESVLRNELVTDKTANMESYSKKAWREIVSKVLNQRLQSNSWHQLKRSLTHCLNEKTVSQQGGGEKGGKHFNEELLGALPGFSAKAPAIMPRTGHCPAVTQKWGEQPGWERT